MKIQDITEGYGRYYCSTDKKWKTRKGPKQTRKVNEFAPDGFNGGDDGGEFSPEMAKMAYDEGVVKGASLADGATTQRAMAINDWDKHDGGMYSQHFAKGFIAGRKDKIRHNNKQYNLNLQLMKDGSIRHGEQGVAEGSDNITAVFSGYGNYMKGRGANVFKHYGITVLDQQYDEDEDIVEYTVSGTKEALDQARAYLERSDQFGGMILQQGVAEEKQRLDPKCWDGYKKDGTKVKGGVRVNNCVKKELEETYDGDEFFEAYGELWYNEDEQLDEAEYQGRSVPLGKPMQGDVKKFKVYVKDPSTGNVKKVNFGDPDMKIRKSNPAARRSFRARHNCDNPGPRTKARYWSCRKW